MRWWFDVQLTIALALAGVLASVFVAIFAGLLVPESWADSVAGYVHVVGLLAVLIGCIKFWQWRRARA